MSGGPGAYYGALTFRNMTREAFLAWLESPAAIEWRNACFGKPRVRVPAGSSTAPAPKYER